MTKRRKSGRTADFW